MSPTRLAPVPLWNVRFRFAARPGIWIPVWSVMFPASVPVAPLSTTTLFPAMSCPAMSLQLRLAPVAFAVNVVVPATVALVMPTVAPSDSVMLNAGVTRSSSAVIDSRDVRPKSRTGGR